MRRIEALPEATQLLLFAAAAEPAGDVTVLLRALAALEIAPARSARPRRRD
jgi:hypothetical protein